MDEQLGKVIEWQDDRGFGFIQPRESAERLFFHVREYRQDGRRPQVGEWVKYRKHRAEDGRWQAAGVRRAASPVLASATRAPRKPTAHGPAMPASFQWLLITFYVALLAWAINAGRLPLEFAGVPLLMSAITWVAYALDKHAAQTGRWRTQETVLHVLELLGGWPGAIAAQQWLRHKTRKGGYRIAFWSVTVLHVAAVLGWVFWRG